MNKVNFKRIWDGNDFDHMNWHDCKVYAMAFNEEDFELLLDIDYIFKWEPPSTGEGNYKFWVSPVTLVFYNIWDINLNISSSLDLVIENIVKGENAMTPKNVKYIKWEFEYNWEINMNVGDICFKSVGFEQYVRREPILIDHQKIGCKEREGISFEKICYQ